MRRIALVGITVALFVSCCLIASQYGRTQDNNRSAGQPTAEEQAAEAAMAAVLNDKRLLSLHREFVNRAEKLALEYEKNKDWDKAKTVWGEILKIAPQYELARTKMQQLLEREANANVVRMKVLADEGWQDTGVIVLPGKPIRIRAAGYWTFGLKMKLTPDGIQIPKELREYNLGCLIGAIDTGNPDEVQTFVVGSEKGLEPDRPGRLMLRMYDISPEDNDGELEVEIRGTFERG